MLDPELFLQFLTWVEGRSLSSVLADRTGLSQRRCRDTYGRVNSAAVERVQQNSLGRIENTLKASGFSDVEIDEWMKHHPGVQAALNCYSGLVYECELSEVVEFPRTRKFAGQVDALTIALEEKASRNDLEGFKESLQSSQLASRKFMEPGDKIGVEFEAYEFATKVQLATTWNDLNEPVYRASANLLLTFLAKWDVEFGTQVYFQGLQPRSIFAMVLPRLDPAAERVDGKLKPRRDMFWLPVRRLIDFMACVAFHQCSALNTDRVPSVRDIAIEANIDEKTLVNWRDGTKKFTKSHFLMLWKCLHAREARDRTIPFPPWPLFVATIFWQNLLASVNTKSGERTIKLHQEEYLQLWQRELDELKGEGASFGEAPWPGSFDQF